MGQGHGVKGGLISEVILVLVSLATKGIKLLPCIENLKRAGNSNLLLWGVTWHFLLAMEPN